METLRLTIEGELIGDSGFRNDGWMWTQLNDHAYASSPIVDGGPLSGPNVGIGIRMPTGLGEDLDPPVVTEGGDRSWGVTGVWRYHDPERQGESYLEVESIETIEPGRALGETPDWRAIVLGLVLLAGAAALVPQIRRRSAEA